MEDREIEAFSTSRRRRLGWATVIGGAAFIVVPITVMVSSELRPPFFMKAIVAGAFVVVIQGVRILRRSNNQ